MASEFISVGGVRDEDLAEVVLLSSLADETPEGRSIVQLADAEYGLTPRDMPGAELVPFTAQTRMSGIEWQGRSIRKGAADSVRRWAEEQGGSVPPSSPPWSTASPSTAGLRSSWPKDRAVLGVIHLKDTVKEGMAERFAEMRVMGIRTIMITGDNPLTAKAIAQEAGVDDFLAEATPEDKMAYIKREQAGRRARRHDRRRHQRRTCAGASGRRCGHEHRHPGRQRGRQHG